MKIFAGLMASIGAILACSASTVCLNWLWDEPECPKCLLK